MANLRFSSKLAPFMAVLFIGMLLVTVAGRHATPPWTTEEVTESSNSIMIMRKFGYSKTQMEHLRRLSSSTDRYTPGGPDSQHHSHPPRLP